MLLGRRAPALAAAVLTLGAAATARAEPLDVRLARIGPPDEAVWIAVGALPSQALGLANDAKRRFAVLSNDLALAMSSALLQPGSTTGHSGFDIAFEGSYTGVHGSAIGEAPLGFTNRTWPTNSAVPRALVTSGVHVRKALPFSLEMGGRLTYLARTSYVAAQGEAKWALNEGFESFPDVAVRAAYTRLFGQQEWNLDATDLDLLVSKRWGVSAVTSLTPYVAARFTFVRASSERLDFGSGPLPASPGAANVRYAAFPELRNTLYRTTVGVRLTADTVSLALEGTVFARASHRGPANAEAGEYPDYRIGSSFSGGARFGWEF
jgi:hypothetical protein